MGFSLLRATITERNTIICSLHKSEFDIKTGEVIKWAPFPPVLGPALGILKKEKKLRIYDIQIHGDVLLIRENE